MLDIDNELEFIDQGYDLVVGIDEVGRGSWAGPLYMCAYVYENDQLVVSGVNDSKLLSIQKRKSIYKELRVFPYIVNTYSNDEIDKHGLGKTVNIALKSLVEKVESQYQGKKLKFLVDGYFKGKWNDNVDFIKKGDQSVYSIAAASVIAKVERDNWMIVQSRKYKGYDFENNVGYGTKKHRQALEKKGVCPIHRMSYKPIKRILKQKTK
ncbi:ribonuclease HII [Candidatus Dojkabacteria bacterium]|nr:ribonuclease HII [Candidatus Dojkabacteria bacterium]